jgi:hypothetical protein
MYNTAKKLKEIVKGPAPKSTFGTDPRDPWSAKAGITEGALEQYLMSRGINPNFVSKDTKISHAKSSSFLKWKRDHMMEETDKKDTVVLDIPLLIRVLELAREDIKTDMDLHRVVEKLISIRTKGVLTMDDYNTIADIKENHIAIAMGKMLDDEGSMVLDQMDQLERAITMIRNHIGKDYEKQLPAWVQSKITLATDYVDTVGNYLSTKNEEVVSEVSSELLDRYKEKAKKSADELTAKGQHKKSTDRWMNVMKATGKQIEKTTGNIRKALNKEDKFQDTYAATQTVGPEVESADNNSNKMSKSAKIIKSLYKNKGVAEGLPQILRKVVPGYAKREIDKKMDDQKFGRTDVDRDANYYRYKKIQDKLKKQGVAEDMYDTEKEDKSVASYGRPPKMSSINPNKNIGDKAQAAAVLTGGKTLTGKTRDTLEIDPIMRKAGPLDQNKKI